MKISKEIKVGIIALLTIAAFWWLFNFLKGNDLFTQGNNFYVYYDNVAGLAETRGVTLNGLKVGRVEEIEPQKTGNAQYNFKVKLVIDDNFELTKNTIAEIYEPGFMSGKEIRLIPDSKGEIAKSGDILIGKVNTSLTEMLSKEIMPVKDNLNIVLMELDSTLNSTQKLLDAENTAQIKQAVRNLNGTILSFKSNSENVNTLLNNNQQKISSLLDNSNAMVSEAKTTIGKYGTLADKLNKVELEKTMAQLEQNLNQLNTLLDKANRGEGSLGKLLNDKELYDNLNTSSKNLSLLLEDFKKNPKNYVNFSVFGKRAKPIEETKE